LPASHAPLAFFGHQRGKFSAAAELINWFSETLLGQALLLAVNRPQRRPSVAIQDPEVADEELAE
jgi:hypothetical protein